MPPPLEWTQFRLHILEGSMTYEEVPWASFHGRWMALDMRSPAAYRAVLQPSFQSEQ
jgi:hypothetical protein